MAYESVKNQIDAYIKANGVNLITGPVLNAVLTTMLDELGEGYAFQGALNTTDTPSPAADIPQAWLASAGTYLGGSITVDEDELALIIHTADGWSKETVYRGIQLSYDAIVEALGYTPADEANLAEKQDTIADLPAIRSGAALGSTSVQPTDIEDMVEAEPVGSIIPPVNPSEFATKEELSQLDGKVSQLQQGLPLNLINKGIVSEWDGFNSASNKFVSLIQGHTYKFAIIFQNSGSLGAYANVKLMTDTSWSSVKKIIDLANDSITAGDIVTAELLWSDASVENYRLGVYGNDSDKLVFNGAEISVMDITIDRTKQDIATNTARLVPITPIGFISTHETDKIAITDSTITIPKNTRIVYGLNGFSYTATQSSATVINRDSNYEQFIVFNIGTKTIVGRMVNAVQTDDVILFLVQNTNTNKRKISLHPSLYTYDGEAPFVMQSEGLYKTAQTLSDSEKTQVLTNFGIEWAENGLGQIVEQTQNIFLLRGFEGKAGLTINGNEVSGMAIAFHNAFGGYKYVTPYAKTIKPNTQYTLSFKVRNEGGESTTGAGLQARFIYSDNTLGVAFSIGNNRTSWIDAGTATSAAGKTLVGIGFSYGAAGSNIWHIKDLQLEEGTSKTEYTPPYSAVDSFARDGVKPLLSLLPYTRREGYMPDISSFTNVYVISNTVLLKGHTYKATIQAETPFTAPSDFNLKIVNSSSDSTILRIMTLGGLTISEKTETFKWENESVNDYRVGFYGNGSVSTPINVYLIDVSLDALIAEQGAMNWDVVNRNRHKEAALISVASRSGNENIKVANKLTLLHFSDVHGNTANLANIVTYGDHYSDLLDDIIHTGDSVLTKMSDTNPFVSVEGAENILNVIGNHEAWVNTSDPDYYATEKQTYDKIFAPSIANWGVVQPTGAAENGYCYYYKDFTTAGFRLIVLDSVHWHYRNGTTDSNPAQKSWLESVLADAITQNLRVVCATHYTPQNGIIPVGNTGFNVLGTKPGANIADGWYAADEIFGCVDNFIGDGGKFAGWICGHTHEDYFGTVYGHTSQPIVIVGTSKGSGSVNNKFIAGTISQDNFNVITFENLNAKDYIKIVKIGQDTDIYTRSKNTICYNFTDSVLVSTT